MTMKKKFWIILSAAFGGISPNVFRLAVSLTQGNDDLPGATYLLGLLIFAVMGAAVALIWEETDFKRAFYLGIGLPAFIQMGAGEISTAEKMATLTPAPARVAVQQHAPRYADMAVLPAARRSEGRQIKLIFREYQPRCSVVFAGGDSTAQLPVDFPPRTLNKTVKVPDFAGSFRIRIGVSYSNPLTLDNDPDTIPAYRITVVKSWWNGFRQALGLRGESYVIQVERDEG